jgi:probable HAF family extracellular repeat protein
MRIPVRRLAFVPLALLVCSCSASDAALGPDGSRKDPAEGATTSATVMSRVDLGTLGGASSYAADINGSGIVVGWSETNAGATHAFRWSAAAGMVDLGTLPGDPVSRAVAVLDGTQGGQILGVSGSDGRWTPVVWSASGSISALPIPLVPGFTTALPTDFNGRGDVVGSDANGFQHGWIWSAADGKFDLSANVQGGSYEGSAAAVTASGLVALTTSASTCKRATCWRGYLWAKSTGYRALGTPDHDPDASVAALGLNESGTVVGWTASTDDRAAPYVWGTGKGFTRLSTYSSDATHYGYATGVSSSGTVVGAGFDPIAGSIVASAWLANGTIVRLSPEDPNPSVAVAISEAGTIAGWSAFAGGVNHAVVWQSAPQGTHVTLRTPTSVAIRVNTASSACLADASAIISRQSLFGCVIRADRSHKR